MNASELNERFGEPGLRFDEGNGGLTRATLSTPGSEAEVYLYGGHVTRFDRKGEKPVLFMSAQSLFKPGKAIRGGIPLIFPWFGPNAARPLTSGPLPSPALSTSGRGLGARLRPAPAPARA